MDKTSLGDRMKGYERTELRLLTRRAPVIIRLDGKSFHSFTKGFDRPFDLSFLTCMRNTMLHLCENIMGAKLGYTQSDEITLLLTDDDTLETDAWFGKNLQKIVSVSAAMATYYFNKEVAAQVESCTASTGLRLAYERGRTAIFDSRAFTVPREEVLNCFEWRQQDCRRNSVQAMGYTYFSQKELNGLSCAKIVEKLRTIDMDWNALYPEYQNGVCARKHSETVVPGLVERGKWALDKCIPIFHEHPEYINDLVYHKE